VVRVYKSIGAVRIYSPRNAIALAIAALAVVIGLGVLIGYFARGSGSSAKAATITRVVRVSDPVPPPTPAPARGYRAGFKAGVAAVLGNPHGFSSGGYVVRLVPGQSGPLTIAQHIALTPGFHYWLCAGGTRICFQRYG
jgi:hypothetical protein